MPTRAPSNARAARLVEPLLREPVDRFVLSNGLTVLIRPDHSAQVASVQVWIKSGSIHEAPRLGSGVSHYLEHMLFKGTEKRAGRDISAVVQAHGGYINAYTSFDRTVYYIDLPSEHTEVALDVLGDAVFHSQLPAAEVTKERDVILREIDMGLDDPDYRVSQALMETAFREHPYRHPVIGHREVFAALTRDDLVDYYRTRYVPNNAVLVIAGAVDPVALRSVIEKHFGSVPRARLAPVLVPDEPGQLAGRRIDLADDVQVFRAALGYQVPGLAHPDTPALDILSLILGHGDSSILWQTLREKRKLVHHVDASNWNPGSKGLFFLTLIGDPDKGAPALAALHEEIERACARGFTEAQLRKAVRQALVAEINVRRSMSGQASRLGIAEVVVGDLDYPATYLQRLASLTPATLNRVARQYLVPANLSTSTLVPKNGASAASIAARAAAAKSDPDFDAVTLPGGARVLFRENARLPQVHLRVVWQGGPAFEPADRRGATALLSTLLTLDTKKRSSAAVALAIEEVGGSFNDFSGNNSFGFSLEVLPDDLDLALDLFEQAMVYPAFKATTVAREREAQAAEIAEENDDIVTAARRQLREKFFGAHPLAAESAGTVESVARLDVATLKALHRQLVVAGNTVIAVSGDFRRAALLPKLKRILAKLPRGGTPEVDTRFSGPARTGEVLAPMDRQQVVVMEAYTGTGLLDPDFYVGEVTDELFSGMSSNLFERVREEKSLAYFVRSARIIGLQTGMFFFMAGTSTQGYPQVVKEFAAEIKRVAAGRFLDGELERCRTRLKAARRMSMQSNASCAAQAALNALYGLPVNDWRNYDAHIDAVTAADVAHFAKTRFVASQQVRLLAGALKG
ncbi:MAG: insulinase family protein [Opitutaceae bacterium]|nr:insulinase family protein [Opitutaceae bacterium]